MESSESPNALVPPSLYTLLDGILDYAGLFPPADLSLPQAIHNFAGYRDENEAWMLSRFVLPVRRLPDLTPFHALFSQGAPYRFSVLGTGGTDRNTFLDAFDRDLDALDTFDEEYGGRAQVDVMEVPVPESLIGSRQGDIEEFFDGVDQRLIQKGTAKLDLFFELPLESGTVDELPTLCAALAEHNSQQALPARSIMGLKMRCGGGDPTAVPTAEHAAALIVACRDAGLPFKATAGLHHPMRHYDDGLDTEMHGFLNVFCASVLASEHTLDPEDVQTILLEDTSSNFRFEKEGFSWRNLSASLDGIRYARENLALSFGSCSFEEPVDHLRDLELL